MKSKSTLERLEPRIAPAAVLAPASFTYTDADGDLVSVHVTGTAGSIEFLDALGGDVAANGGDLAKIFITAPSADLAISFADTNAPTGAGLGDNVIKLGQIAGAGGARLPLIKGIFTAATGADVEYQLGGYTGVGFSPGGGLSILGPLVGDGLGATTDVSLKSLGKGASVRFEAVDVGSSLRIDGAIAGKLHVGSIDGDVALGALRGFAQIGHVEGTLTITKGLAGRLVLGDADLPETEEVSIIGNIAASGRLDAASDLVLHVGGAISGDVLTRGSLTADVGGGLNGATLLIGGTLQLDVAGPVAGSAMIAQQSVLAGTVLKQGMTGSSVIGGTGLNVEITGSVATSRFSGGTGDTSASISGRLVRSQFVGGGDATIDIGLGVSNSRILPDGRLTLDIGVPPQASLPGLGNATASFIGSRSTSAVVNIGGRTFESRFTAGTDLEITAGAQVDTTFVQAGNDLTVTAGRDVIGSRFAAGSDGNVAIGGRLSTSLFIIGNNFNATVGTLGVPVSGSAAGAAAIEMTRIETSDGSSEIEVVGRVQASIIESGQNATLRVADLTGIDPKDGSTTLLQPGAVRNDVWMVVAGDASVFSTGKGTAAPRVLAGHDAAVEVRHFTGAVSAGNDIVLRADTVALDPLKQPAVLPTSEPILGDSVTAVAKAGIRAGGDLTFVVTRGASAARIDVVGDVKDFRVGGAFAGKVTVAGNFAAGSTASAATVVGGSVSPSSFLYVGGDLGTGDTAPQLIFGQGFAGRIEVGGNVATDLMFAGDVRAMLVHGAIGGVPAGGAGDAVADIIVKGKLGSLTSATVFTRTSASGGTFANAAGTILGAIAADLGAPRIGPLLS